MQTSQSTKEANISTSKNTSQRCTKEKCFGLYNPNQFHAQNKNSRRAWIEKKIWAGEWKGQIPE